MMVDAIGVLSYAQRLAGERADTTVLTAMCAAAAAELEARLKSGVSAEELGETFTAAAGVLALSMYCAVRNVEGLKSFRAGELSVEYADGEVSPEALRQAAEGMLSAYLADHGFGFRGVPG